MGRHELEYPRSSTNKANRHDERASYALRTIHALVNSSPLVHVSFNVPGSPFPTNLPMIGQMGSFSHPSSDISDPLDLYLHGYVSARLFNLGRDNTGKEGEEGDEKKKGLPVCVAASHVDGIVFALSAFNHSYNYRSALLFGHAELVADTEEKLYAMELITNGIVPGHWSHTRLPPTGAELQSTSILRVRIESGSAKTRDGGASDDKHDMENDAVRDNLWTGVIPVYQAMGDPIASHYSKVDFPAHIREHKEEVNKDNEEYSVSAAKK